MPSRVLRVRIFLASPGDVAEERKRVAQVIERLNRTLGESEAVVLDLVRWETHAWPGFGQDAQDVINAEIGPYDVFIGVMWKRLGTPTNRAPSGTVEEFERAFDAWKQHETPKLMFYFSRVPFSPELDEFEQHHAVLRFKQLLADKGALAWQYASADEFESVVHEHLYRQVRQLMTVSESANLSRSLAAENLTLDDLTAGNRSLDDVPAAQEIRRLLQSLLERVEQFDRTRDAHAELPAHALLEAAHGLLADRRWAQAAYYFDRYVAASGAADWDAFYGRAVAHANARGGRASNVSALRAYSDAIALRPDDLDPNLLARLFSYRGAMCKRLGRLAEAEADLKIAEAHASHPYERADVQYNLAGVYAMSERPDEAFAALATLRGTRYLAAVRAHAHTYFAPIAGDPRFERLVTPPGAD